MIRDINDEKSIMIHLSRHRHLRPNLDVVSRIAPLPITTMRKGKLDAWNSSRIPCAFDSVALSLVSEVGDDANN